MALSIVADDSIFEPFDIFEETYKTVDSHPIQAAILTPKALPSGRHPVLVNVHGGFLVNAIPSEEDTRAWIAASRSRVKTEACFELLPLAVAATKHGLLYKEVFLNSGADEVAFNPIERLRADARLPKKAWILHGDADSVVYLRQSTAFADLAAEKSPDTTLRLDVARGQDHGFDSQSLTWEADHAPGALNWVRQSWLGQ